MTTPPASLAQRIAIVWGSLILIVASLYWAKPLIVPIVLALLFTFVLTPPVLALQRRRLGRIPAVLIVVTVATAALIGVGWVMLAQMQQFVAELPEHRHTIMDKVASFQGPSEGPLSNLSKLITDINKEVTGAAEAGGAPGGPAAAPVQVVVRENSSMKLDWLPAVLGTVAELIITAALILVLVIFMLIQRESLRNRLLRILSRGHFTNTTRALDDAAQRISGYLISQTLINVGFGVVLAVAMALVGMPYPVLWGAMAALLRFVPYVGTWAIGGVLALFSVAIYPGWTEPLVVMAVFITLELLAAYAVEPLVLGHGTGVSPVALLIAAAFWAWLWGPIGLILAPPMTVCLMVLGRHVPQLEVFGILLGDEPSLAPWESYYQRLLARDEEEATDLVEEYVRSNPPETLADTVIVPALVQAERDAHRGNLDTDVREEIFQSTRELLEDVVFAAKDEEAITKAEGNVTSPTVIVCPAADEADELALRMFAQMINPARAKVIVLSHEQLASEMVATVEKEHPAAVVVGGVPPRCLARSRYLCKRLRAAVPDLKILAGYWGGKERAESVTRRLQEAGANHVGTSLQESRTQLLPYLTLAAGSRDRTARPRAVAGTAV